MATEPADAGMADADDPAEIFHDEWLLVRHSGETPEIALHAAIYHLSRAKDGPKLCLTPEQLQALRRAATERFAEIVLRDLCHANAGTAEYRGICRSIVNFRRFQTFSGRQGIEAGAYTDVRAEAAAALRTFLRREVAETVATGRPSLISCSHRELVAFAAELGLSDDLAPFALLCPRP